jgi:hypothetical protein
MGTQSLDCTDFAIVVAEQDREFFVLPGGHRASWELDERDGGNRGHQTP